MRAVIATACRAATEPRLAVLIQGPTGTGKTVLARLIHHQSVRCGNPCIVIACATIPEYLAESELFGHLKGAFTGAIADKPGRLALCHGGTCILDDVAGLPPPVQTKLFQFLDDGTFTPLGGTRILTADVRVIATSSQPLKAASDAGRFRIDLYYRLGGVRIFLPPLARRPEDIRAIVESWLARNQSPMRLDGSAWTELFRYGWPGNVRELENLMPTLRLLGRIDIGGPDIVAALQDEDDWSVPAAASPHVQPVSYRETIDACSRKAIQEALEATHGCRSQAAKRLGLPKSTLLDLIRRLGPGSFDRPEIRPDGRESGRGGGVPHVSTKL